MLFFLAYCSSVLTNSLHQLQVSCADLQQFQTWPFFCLHSGCFYSFPFLLPDVHRSLCCGFEHVWSNWKSLCGLKYLCSSLYKAVQIYFNWMHSSEICLCECLLTTSNATSCLQFIFFWHKEIIELWSIKKNITQQCQTHEVLHLWAAFVQCWLHFRMKWLAFLFSWWILVNIWH